MSKRGVELYLLDIKDSAKAIFDYVQNINFEEFLKDRKTRMAVIKEFEIIGEAVGKLPKELRKHYREVKWQDIKDFRNLLTHEYFGIDLEIVWKVIKNDLPVLLKTINKILTDIRREKNEK